MNLHRSLFVLCTVLTLTSPLVADEDFATAVAPLLRQHCYACHGEAKHEAQVRFDRLTEFDVADSVLWTKVYQQVASGEMPPADTKQPTDRQRQQVLSWIAAQQREHRQGGTRRLNRREFSAALQDLTGVSVDYAAALPGDGMVAGFDTGADALQDAADSVAQWMVVTRRAVDAIRFLEPPSETTFASDLRDVKDIRKAFDPWKEQGATVKGRTQGRPGMGLIIEPKWVGERGGMEIFVPSPENRSGVMRLKLTVAASKPLEDIPNPRLWVEIGAKDIAYPEITGTIEAPQELVYEVQLDDLAIGTRGVSIELGNRVEVPYSVPGFENEDRSKPDEKIPGGPGLFRPVFDRKKTPQEEQPVPFIVVQEIKIEPDYVAAWPPETWGSDLGEIRDDAASAERLLNLWTERAWRRPVSDTEHSRFLALYYELRKHDLSFDEALRATFQSVLLSGGFRYLTAPRDTPPELAQYAIAARLSFFLWSSPPDEELSQLAAAGQLRDPAILGSQVDRLLDDPRSRGFVRPFVTQWLELGQPITITMDYFQKQDFRFARHLKESMRGETVAYVARLIAENRPARELISSDWTMMNDILAMHYGYPDVGGGELRPVQLRGDDPRGGGILGQAGIQSMLCWMGDNWVIYRGAWALRHILNAPPPPPPLEVPELIPSDNENRGKTFRQLLAEHQENERCSVCHKSIDPLGFAFQNFDISGRWRDLEYEHYTRNELDGKIEWRGSGKSRPVDAEGQLPRGEEFHDFQEFKALLVEHYLNDLTRGLLENLFLYSTGRLPDVADQAEISAIIEAQQSDGYRLRSLLKSVVLSQAFLEN